MSQIGQVAEALLEYIDAIPKSVADALPAMPGIDRDWVNETIAREIAATQSIARGKVLAGKVGV